MKLLTADLGGPLVDEEWTSQRKKRILDYFDYSGVHFNNWYLFRFALCEFLNFVNVIGQIYLLDDFFGGQFRQYGPSVVTYIEKTAPWERADPMELLFPKVTKCTFNKFGPSGSVQPYDALCILPLNVVNEKIFIFLWFWFVILAILTGFIILYRLVILIPQV